jgi:hypothetical protein
LRVTIFRIFVLLFAWRLQWHYDLAGRNRRKSQGRFPPAPQVLFFQPELHQRVQEKHACRRYHQENNDCHQTNPSTPLPVLLRKYNPQRGCENLSGRTSHAHARTAHGRPSL